MPCLLFASFTPEAPCGFGLQHCLLCLQTAYLPAQPWGQFVLLLRKWAKLIGSRRCVLSAGDLGTDFIVLVVAFFYPLKLFSGFLFTWGYSDQNEAPVLLHLLVSSAHLSSFGDQFFFFFPLLEGIRCLFRTEAYTSVILPSALTVGYRHSALHTLLYEGSPGPSYTRK